MNIESQLRAHARQGGKTSRRRQVARVRQFQAFCRNLGVREAHQIGKIHAWQWYEEGDLSDVTLRDRYYAEGVPNFV